MPPILTTSPDPDTRTPQFKCPPGTVDTHVHLFGPADNYAWDPNTYYVARDATPEMNIALQDKLGFSNSVIVSGGAYGRNYTHLSDTLTRFPDAFPRRRADPRRPERRGIRPPRQARGARHAPVQRVARRRAADDLGADRGDARTSTAGTCSSIRTAPTSRSSPTGCSRCRTAIVLDHFASVQAERGLEQPGIRTL